jgi:hypothetical protein
MRPSVEHQSVEIESFQTEKAGVLSKVQLRPLRGQKFSSHLLLEGNKSLIVDYPVGTQFKVQAALMNRASGGGQFLFTSWQWDSQVLRRPDDEAA